LPPFDECQLELPCLWWIHDLKGYLELAIEQTKKGLAPADQNLANAESASICFFRAHWQSLAVGWVAYSVLRRVFSIPPPQSDSVLMLSSRFLPIASEFTIPKAIVRTPIELPDVIALGPSARADGHHRGGTGICPDSSASEGSTNG
jgi:hypothetical protein